MDYTLAVADVAKRINRVPSTVRALAQRGQLPCIKTSSGRRLFRQSDVENLLTKRREAYNNLTPSEKTRYCRVHPYDDECKPRYEKLSHQLTSEDLYRSSLSDAQRQEYDYNPGDFG